MSRREQFNRAWRLTRTAFRGEQRAALKLDLRMEPTFEPSCRRCNAGAAVAGKVLAAIGYGDPLAAPCVTLAVSHALGASRRRQHNMPHPLDHAGWMEWRAWATEIRRAA